MRLKIPDPETGSKWGRLTVVGAAKPRNGKKFFNVVCGCGQERVVQKHHLTNNHTRSCGCLKSDLAAERGRTHGQRGSRTHWVWGAMKDRCLNPANKAFSSYGGRGVSVCAAWLSFEAFYLDMGDPPQGHSLDRIDTQKGYEPGNCRWTDAITQANNTRRSVRYMVHGEVLTLGQASEKYKINSRTLATRVYRGGLTLEQAIALPLGSRTGLPTANKRTDGFLLYETKEAPI